MKHNVSCRKDNLGSKPDPMEPVSPARIGESIPIKSNKSQGAAPYGTIGARRNKKRNGKRKIFCFQMINMEQKAEQERNT